MALKPFVFIGVGGSGGKTLRAIKQALSGVLDEIGWEGEWPRAWQLLHIDIAAEPDGISEELPQTLGRRDYIAATTTESTYVTTHHVVSNTNRTGMDHYLAWDSWVPTPPEDVNVDISLGAGQYRAVGRVALQGNLKGIAQRIRTALDAASDPAARDALSAIQTARGQNSTGGGGKPEVYLIASIAGGSGSGTMLDISDILRSLGVKNTHAILLTPEVFEQEDGSLGSGIAPNSFQALNELVNSNLVTQADDAPLSRQVLFGRATVGQPLGPSGPPFTLLVGRSNGDVTLGAATEIYRVLGRALADLAMSETLQDEIGAYWRGNYPSNAASIQHLNPLQIEGREEPTRLFSMGFAKLSMGRDTFQQYAIERLSRHSVDRLLDRHLDNRDANDTRDDSALVDALVHERWPSFHRDSGLNEVGTNNNDVLDAIRDLNSIEQLLSTWSDQAMEQVAQIVTGRNYKVSEARSTLQAFAGIHAEERGVRSEARASVTALARAWVTTVQDRLGTLISQEIAQSGLLVTERLVAKLIDSTDAALKELKDEADKHLKRAGEHLQALATRRPEEPENLRADDSELIRQITRSEGAAVLREYIAADTAIAALWLLQDVPRDLLTPLRSAVADANAGLRNAARPEYGRSPVDFWPGTRGIPKHLKPSPVEFLLESVETLPDRFLDVVFQSVSEPGTPIGGQAKAVSQIVSGLEGMGTRAFPPSIVFEAAWIPSWEEARSPGDMPQRAQIRLRVSLDDLAARSRAWVGDDQKHIGRYVRQPLDQFLRDPHASEHERIERRRQLLTQFEAMLRVSSPLVKIDNTMLQLLHLQQQPSRDLKFSPLNIPTDDTKLRDDLLDVAAGVLGSNPQSIPFGDPTSQETQVFSLLHAPYHPIVFASIFEPLVSQWTSERSRGNFWKWRRARPLSEWVPVSPEVRRALVEGWLLGRLLGRTRVVEDAQGRMRLEVLRGSGGNSAWVALSPWGMREITRADAVGNLLELVAISFMEAYQSKSLDPLHPFGDIIKLGSRSDSTHPLLVWIRTGRGVESVDDATLLGLEGPTGTPGERAALAGELVSRLLDSYRGDAAMIEGGHTVKELQENVAVEAAPLAIEALTRLLSFTNATKWESREAHR